MLCCKPVQGLANVSSGQPEVGLQAHTLAAPLINDGEHAKCPPVEHLVVDEIHAPMLVRASGRLRLPPQQRDAFAAFDLHAQLQTLLAGQSQSK